MKDGLAEQKPAGTGKVLMPTARMDGVGDCWPRPPGVSGSAVASRAYASFWAVPTPVLSSPITCGKLPGTMVVVSGTTRAALRGSTCHGRWIGC